MKVLLAPWLDGVSGKFGSKTVFQYRSDILNIRGIQPNGIARVLGQHASYGQILLNIRQVFKLSSSVWMTMTATEKESWKDEAKILATSSGGFYTGIDLFKAYTQRLAGAQYGSGVYMQSLNTSSDWLYANRSNFSWTPAS